MGGDEICQQDGNKCDVMSTPGLFQKCHLDTMCSDYGDYYGCQNISYHRLTLK